MVIEFLREVPLFSSLPEADLARLSQSIEEVRLRAGEELFAEGSPGDRAYVIREGQLEVLKASSGRSVLLAVREPPQVIGEMALLEDKPRTATVRARTDCVLLAIDKEHLDLLMSTSSSAGRAMFYTVLSRWRATEAMLRQSEKMAQLGTLTAGVAHELNNPAAAVKRGADQLSTALLKLEQAQSQLGKASLTVAQKALLPELALRVQEAAAKPFTQDALARMDLEGALEGWLERQGVDRAWELAPPLVALRYEAGGLATLAQDFPPDQLVALLEWLTASYEAQTLTKEIGLAAGRISDIVRALKSYSYLDQAPVQSVDVHEGLDNTLLILRHKLRAGITVERMYAPDLPKIEAYGSELNQVWTNILDNAADALPERGGHISIRTRRDRDGVVVDIEDDGPGIPEPLQSRIFDSFFTTKPPGKGTGLGLNISYNIVVHKHRGDITFTSIPGKTCFHVWLPLNPQPG